MARIASVRQSTPLTSRPTSGTDPCGTTLGTVGIALGHETGVLRTAKTRKAPESGAFQHGGAGSRTPVRASIRYSPYVRRSCSRVSECRGMTARLPNKLLLALTRDRGAPPLASPTFRYLGTPSGEVPPRQVRQAEAYAARAKSVLAIVMFPSGIIQGTWDPGHATASSLDPSKPVAPLS